jgi:cytochrome b561
MSSYSTVSKILHWLIALIILSMLSISFFLKDIVDNIPNIYMIHKSFGITIFVLMIVRFIMIKHYGKPKLPEEMPKWERVFARMVQHSFYLLLVAMPICGWLMSVAANKIPTYFELFHLPTFGITPNELLKDLMKQSHNAIAWILITLIGLHVAGALKHYFIDKDNVLQSMLFRRKNNKQ